MVTKIGGMGVLPQLDIRQKSSRLEYRSTRAYTLSLGHWRSGRWFSGRTPASLGDTLNEWSGQTTKIENHTLARMDVMVRVLKIGSPNFDIN